MQFPIQEGGALHVLKSNRRTCQTVQKYMCPIFKELIRSPFGLGARRFLTAFRAFFTSVTGILSSDQSRGHIRKSEPSVQFRDHLI